MPAKCEDRTLKMYYRLYFLNAAQRITARDEFEAENDETAITIAGLLSDACSDLSSGFELWQSARRVVPDVKKQAAAHPNQSSTAITLQLQSVVLEREEMLQQSQWLIARVSASRPVWTNCGRLGFGRPASDWRSARGSQPIEVFGTVKKLRLLLNRV